MISKATVLEFVKRVRELETEQEKTISAQTAPMESEERFRLISETIHFGVFEIDTEGNCLYTNTRYQKIFGINLVQSVKTPWHNFIVAADQAEIIAQGRAGQIRSDLHGCASAGNG